MRIYDKYLKYKLLYITNFQKKYLKFKYLNIQNGGDGLVAGEPDPCLTNMEDGDWIYYLLI